MNRIITLKKIIKHSVSDGAVYIIRPYGVRIPLMQPVIRAVNRYIQAFGLMRQEFEFDSPPAFVPVFALLGEARGVGVQLQACPEKVQRINPVLYIVSVQIDVERRPPGFLLVNGIIRFSRDDNLYGIPVYPKPGKAFGIGGTYMANPNVITTRHPYLQAVEVLAVIVEQIEIRLSVPLVPPITNGGRSLFAGFDGEIALPAKALTEHAQDIIALGYAVF